MDPERSMRKETCTGSSLSSPSRGVRTRALGLIRFPAILSAVATTASIPRTWDTASPTMPAGSCVPPHDSQAPSPYRAPMHAPIMARLAWCIWAMAPRSHFCGGAVQGCGERLGSGYGGQQRGRDRFGGERRVPDLAERVAQVRPLEVRKVPNAVCHGGSVDVALGVVVTDVRHVGQPFPVERALLIRGESDCSGKGGRTGDRGRMSMRDGGGEGRFIGRPGGVAGPQKAEAGGSGGRRGTRRVGRAPARHHAQPA